MQTYNPILHVTVNAAVDIPESVFVNYAGNICTAGNQALGVSELDASAGEGVSVIALGVALINATGTITVGQAVTSDANGFAVAANGTTDTVNGYALDAATAGTAIRVLIK